MEQKKTTLTPESREIATCPKCGYRNKISGMVTLKVEMRPLLTPDVPVFPDALAEVACLACAGCGYRLCIDYQIELDDNPEMDLNAE